LEVAPIRRTTGRALVTNVIKMHTHWSIFMHVGHKRECSSANILHGGRTSADFLCERLIKSGYLEKMFF
jgi:hypothetical protein